MGESEQDAESDYDDDAPDLSTPEWVAKFAKAPVNPGEPIESTPYRVTRLPDGYIRMYFRRLPDRSGAHGADAEVPPTDTASGSVVGVSTIAGKPGQSVRGAVKTSDTTRTVRRKKDS